MQLNVSEKVRVLKGTVFFATSRCCWVVSNGYTVFWLHLSVAVQKPTHCVVYNP